MTSRVRFFAVWAAMLVAAILGMVLEPTHLLADKGKQVNLESIIPKEFGGWKEIPQLDTANVGTTVPGDESQKFVIYDQTVMRNYRGPNGEIVMLAASYGVRQNNELKIHMPEVCYVAHGFQILKQTPGEVRLGNVSLPVTRVVTRNDKRIEPVTYWVRIGDETVRGGLHLRLTILKAGLMGAIPDGLLMRVSTITGADSASQSSQEFDVQAAFLGELLASAAAEQRAFLIGKRNEL